MCPFLVLYRSLTSQPSRYRLIGYMWEEMARQESIDEQRVRRQGFAREDPVVNVGESGAGVVEDNDDIDPNDAIQPMAHSAPALNTAAKPVGMYDSDEEDDDFY